MKVLLCILVYVFFHRLVILYTEAWPFYMHLKLYILFNDMRNTLCILECCAGTPTPKPTPVTREKYTLHPGNGVQMYY